MLNKLTKKEQDLLWGETGPYSEAKIVMNTRILDDSISRVMVEVEGNINPTTFRIVEKHKKFFAKDEDVLSLLRTAVYENDGSGYRVAIGEPEELEGDHSEVLRNASKKQEYLKETIFKMHSFVMTYLEIDSPKPKKKKEETVKGVPSRYF